MKLGVLIAAVALLCGCATKEGRCYPIVGLGWTVVNTNQPGAVRIKTTILGFGMATKPAHCVVGFGQTDMWIVETNANLLIELK